MNVQEVFEFKHGFDLERTIKNIEASGDELEQRPTPQGSWNLVIRLRHLPGVTITVHGRKICIYYDNQYYSIGTILQYIRNMFVNEDGKPAEMVFVRENKKVYQKIKGIVALTGNPLIMDSPHGEIVAIKVSCGTINGSICPSGCEKWFPLRYRSQIS